MKILKLKQNACLLVALCLLLAGCKDNNNGNTATIPRREAYPRIEPYNKAYQVLSVGKFAVSVNKASSVEYLKPSWVNVRYPRYGLTLHLTALEPDNQEEFENDIARRLERMALNIGDSNADDTTATTKHGLNYILQSSYDGIPTPLQFIAFGNGRDILSGTVAFTGPSTPADSVAPIIDAMKQELDTLLNSTCIR